MMRAIVLDNGLAFRSDYPPPARPPGESIVRVLTAGICGTDLELARGYMGWKGVLGHEFVGEVVESETSGLVGRRVVGGINAACRRCRLCAQGLERHCPNRTVLGILGRDGAFADLLALPDGNLYPVPDSVPDELAVFTEPVAAAYEILEQTAIPRNYRVLVLGDGRLGAVAAMVLAAEDYHVTVGGHHREKLAAISALGLAAQPEAELDGGYDVVIDCTGSGAGLLRALELVRPRGTIVLKSTAAAGANLNLAPAVVNEINILGSRCGRMSPALDALAAGRLDPRPLISGIFPLDDGLQALEAAGKTSNLKILIKVS
jgi:threonine dehydrogenase-like Zn-dependent dehydrogenase